MAATKVLVAGDVNGQLDACFARVATVNSAHGPFSCLLCVGDFLGKPEDAAALLAPYKAGERSPPLPTYFLGPPGGALPTELLASTDAGGLVAPGITCLGAAGIHVLSGLKVAFISGAQREAEQLPPDGVAELKRLSQLPGADTTHTASPAPPPPRRTRTALGGLGSLGTPGTTLTLPWHDPGCLHACSNTGTPWHCPSTTLQASSASTSS